MKKIYYSIILIITLIFINSCAGYKPIFSSSDLQFQIAEHSIEGNEKLGNLIYSKLYNISEANKESEQKRNINVIKKDFLGMFIKDFERIMKYDKSSQYVNRKLKRTENPRIK